MDSSRLISHPSQYRRPRVLVGMSGGLDSAVAAILLQEQGYELVGVTFQISYLGGDKDAQELAQRLGIEHHFLDVQLAFQSCVIEPFIEDYAHGRTPNPCVLCNKHIKWGKLLEAADQYGCDYIATGHYAQIAEHRGHYYLQIAADTKKDQTYFLWMLTEENLRRTIFPLGHLTKTEVREIALQHGFEALSKKSESQEICFVPNNDYRTFLTTQRSLEGFGQGFQAGPYLSTEGAIVGKHAGFCNYTIGQRKGLGIALGSPKYVTKIDAGRNEVTLGEHDDLLTHTVRAHQIQLRDTDWLHASPTVQARIRYRSAMVDAEIVEVRGTECELRTQLPVWGVTPGQSLVLYKDGLVVGGGIIA